MKNVHPDHVTALLSLRESDQCSPLVVRSACLQGANIIEKLSDKLAQMKEDNDLLREDIVKACSGSLAEAAKDLREAGFEEAASLVLQKTLPRVVESL